MKRDRYTHHSANLDRDMHVIVYGEEGAYPVIAIPTQEAMADEWEGFGMIDALTPFLDEGKIQLFCVDTIDSDSWTSDSLPEEVRAANQEAYYHYLVDELLPEVHRRNSSTLRPLAVGCDLGATQAALLALRRPDLFEGCIALSGLYRTSRFFGDWMDDTLYDNDVPTFLSNMEPTHRYIELYNERELVFCVGQGAWEDCVDDLRVICEEFDRLGVDAWCDFWGFDVSHDWPWWKRQIVYFLPIVLDQIESRPARDTAKPPVEQVLETVCPKDKGARRFAPAETADNVAQTLNNKSSNKRHKPPVTWVAEG